MSRKEGMLSVSRRTSIRRVVFCVSLFLFWACPSGFAETLYIFQPMSVRPLVMEKTLRAACPGLDITVFGRYRDLNRKLQTDAPDALVTKAPVLEQIGGYDIALRAHREGMRDDVYVLLSVGTPVDPEKLAGRKIGVFDILGRRHMKTFVGTFLPGVMTLKTVSKLQDLLPLLTFDLVEAILIPEHDVVYFEQLSQQHFVTTPVPDMRVGILAMGIRNDGNAPMTATCLKKLDDSVMALLGIEGWEEE